MKQNDPFVCECGGFLNPQDPSDLCQLCHEKPTSLFSDVFFFEKLRTMDEFIGKKIFSLESDLRVQNAALYNERERLKAELKEYRERIEQAAIEELQTTGDKNPAPGVSFQMRKKLQYDAEEATRWAWQNRRVELMTLNKTAFEKEARELDFVEEVSVPTVCIASNLHGEFIKAGVIKVQEVRDEAA